MTHSFPAGQVMSASAHAPCPLHVTSQLISSQINVFPKQIGTWPPSVFAFVWIADAIFHDSASGASSSTHCMLAPHTSQCSSSTHSTMTALESATMLDAANATDSFLMDIITKIMIAVHAIGPWFRIIGFMFAVCFVVVVVVVVCWRCLNVEWYTFCALCVPEFVIMFFL